jgi:hypothetical protein
MTFLYSTYSVVNNIMVKNATTDFEQFFEFEGILDYREARDDEEIDFLIIDWCIFVGWTLKYGNQNLEDSQLVRDVCRAKVVIFANLLVHIPVSNVLKNHWPIPKTWPNKKYRLIHYFENEVTNNNDWIDPVKYNYHLNVFLAYWRRFPFKSTADIFVRTHDTDPIFKPAKITDPFKRKKIFVSANKVRPTLDGRALINETVLEYKNFGYFSNLIHFDQNWQQSFYLKGQLEDPTVNNDLSYNPEKNTLSGTLSPINLDLSLAMHKGNIPHRYYYENSFLSIMGESMDDDDVVISEKTMIPIVNGHWVLPYGGPGFVSYLIKSGVKLAPWIDYSYDRENLSNEKRKELFKKEIIRLCNMPLEEWQSLTAQHINILHENRQLLWNRPFNRLGIGNWISQ